MQHDLKRGAGSFLLLLLPALFSDGLAVSIITFAEVYEGICFLIGPLRRTDGSKFARLHDRLGMHERMSQSQGPVATLQLDPLHQEGDNSLSSTTTACQFGTELCHFQDMS